VHSVLVSRGTAHISDVVGLWYCGSQFFAPITLFHGAQKEDISLFLQLLGSWGIEKVWES